VKRVVKRAVKRAVKRVVKRAVERVVARSVGGCALYRGLKTESFVPSALGRAYLLDHVMHRQGVYAYPYIAQSRGNTSARRPVGYAPVASDCLEANELPVRPCNLPSDQAIHLICCFLLLKVNSNMLSSASLPMVY
jgi:hypothetical protein